VAQQEEKTGTMGEKGRNKEFERNREKIDIRKLKTLKTICQVKKKG